MADKYNSRIVGLVGKLNGNPLYAVTISKDTTVYSCAENMVGGTWRKHEDFHKKQIADEGWLKFMVKYLLFLCWKGYKNNPYEIEARQAETK